MNPKFYSILILFSLCFSITYSQQFNELKRVNHTIGYPNEFYGSSVDIDDTTGIIGAFGNNNGSFEEGSAYIISKNVAALNQWDEQVQLVPSDPAVAKRFGYSVSLHKDIAVVGAPGDDANGLLSGASYVFYRNQGGINNWGQIAKLTASDADTLDQFGYSVSIFDHYIAVGAHCNKDSGECTGAVYVFYKDQGGIDNWGEVKKVIASDADKLYYFGTSVSIDSTTLAVGAVGSHNAIDTIEKGAAYVYYKNQGGINNWGEIKKVISQDLDTNDAFGTDVHLKNDSLLVGSPFKDEVGFPQSGAAYMFNKNQGGADNWGQEQKITPTNPTTANRFGTSVSFDNGFMLIGTEGDSTNGFEAGSSYLFKKQATWQFEKQLFSIGNSADDNFGNSVAISKSFALIGAYNKNIFGNNSGAAYVFVENNAPIISNINDTAICENDSIEIGFTVTDIETSQAGLFNTILSSSNTSLVPNGNVSITTLGSNRTLKIIPSQGQSGQTTITIAYNDTLNGSDTVMFNFTVNQIDSVTVNETICFGDSLFFGASYVKTPGQYTHTYTNLNGCDSVVDLILQVDTVITSITISVNDSSICNGFNSIFTSTAINEGTSPMYSWYVNQTNVGSSSTFSSSTIANGDSIYCILQSSGVCARPDSLKSNIIVMTVYGSTSDTIYDSICEGEVYQSAASNIYDSTGVYIDSVTSTQGCDSIIILHLTVNPIDTTIVNDTICQGDSLVFNNNVLKGEGTFYDTLKNQFDCDSVIQLELVVVPNTLSVRALAIDSNICPNDSLRLYALYDGGGTNTTFIWRRNGGVVSGDSLYVFPSNLASSGDVFTVEIFSSSYCFTNQFAISDTLKLFQRANTFVDIYDTVCSALPYNFGGQSITSSGTYYDTTSASTFCDSITTLYLVMYPVPIAPNITQIGDTLYSDSWYNTYQWLHNGTLISGANDSSYIANLPGIYRVEVIDSNGCSILSYPWTFSPVGLDELGSRDNFIIYPNPANDELNIQIKSEEIKGRFTVNIFDLTGKKHISRNFNSKDNHKLDINILTEGMYILQIKNAQYIFSRRFLKEH